MSSAICQPASLSTGDTPGGNPSCTAITSVPPSDEAAVVRVCVRRRLTGSGGRVVRERDPKPASLAALERMHLHRHSIRHFPPGDRVCIDERVGLNSCPNPVLATKNAPTGCRNGAVQIDWAELVGVSCNRFGRQCYPDRIRSSSSRSCSAGPNSNCGRSSEIWNHGAPEPTQKCASDLRPGS